MKALFPQSNAGVSAAWTVADQGMHGAHVIDLTDDTFIVHKQIKDLKHPVVDIDGKKAIHGHMPKGSSRLRSHWSSC